MIYLKVVIFSLHIFAHVFSTGAYKGPRKIHPITKEDLEATDWSLDNRFIHKENSLVNTALPSDSSRLSPVSQENGPQVLLQADYSVGKSGILLSNRGAATQGDLLSTYSVTNIQTDNTVKDGLAKYTTIEVPPSVGARVMEKEALEPSSTSRNHKFGEKLKSSEISYKDGSQVDLVHRSKASNFPTSKGEYFHPRQTSSQNYQNGAQVIKTKIVAEKDGFLSEDSAIQASSLPLITYYPQSSYQMGGRYKNADVKNFLISAGGGGLAPGELGETGNCFISGNARAKLKLSSDFKSTGTYVFKGSDFD